MLTGLLTWTSYFELEHILIQALYGMTHALNDDDDILPSIVGNLKIEVLGLVTKS